jgi:hypothetical protein
MTKFSKVRALHKWTYKLTVATTGIHIDDLASAIILLTEEALKGSDSKAAWLPEGYYFVEDNEFVGPPSLFECYGTFS